jgi:hypothetical protein
MNTRFFGLPMAVMRLEDLFMFIQEFYRLMEGPPLDRDGFA